MNRKFGKLYGLLLCIMYAILIIYTYAAMNGLIFGTMSSIGSYCKTFIFLLSVPLLVFNYDQLTRSKMGKIWLCWLFFYTIEFFIFRLGGDGKSNFFSVCFAPLVYITSYICTLHNDKSLIISGISSLIIGLVACVLIHSFYQFNNVDLANVELEEIGVNNLVFFLLCVLPFLFLIKNMFWKNILFFVVVYFVLLTSKRSALISVFLIYGVFLYELLIHDASNKNRKSKLLLVILVLMFVFIVQHSKIGSFLEYNQQRVENISEDKGSGRIPLYEDVIDDMFYLNHFASWLLGNGYGSIRLTGHTNAHNDALQMLFEYGIAGLILYLWFFMAILKKTSHLYRMKHCYFVPYAASFIIVLMLGLVSNLVVFYSYFAYITSFWGVIDGMLESEKSNQNILCHSF